MRPPPALARPNSGAGGLAPRCEKCERPHREDLPCWVGSYRKRVSEQAYRTHGRACWQCRREGVHKKARQIDHVIPRALGGGDEMRNLQPLCAKHNQEKGAKITSPYGPQQAVAGNGQPVSSRFR